jgi:predicted RNase H-related nuclease YkuK (DUF458 family)
MAIANLLKWNGLQYSILILELRESNVSPCEQCSLGEMARTKMKYENKQRAIAQKIISEGQQFLCTALLTNKIYHSMKFQVHIFYNLWEMVWTKIKYENIKGKNSKIRNAEYRSLYTAIILNEIYHPMKFHVYSTHTWGEMTWTKIKYEN